MSRVQRLYSNPKWTDRLKANPSLLSESSQFSNGCRALDREGTFISLLYVYLNISFLNKN